MYLFLPYHTCFKSLLFCSSPIRGSHVLTECRMQNSFSRNPACLLSPSRLGEDPCLPPAPTSLPIEGVASRLRMLDVVSKRSFVIFVRNIPRASERPKKRRWSPPPQSNATGIINARQQVNPQLVVRHASGSGFRS